MGHFFEEKIGKIVNITIKNCQFWRLRSKKSESAIIFRFGAGAFGKIYSAIQDLESAILAPKRQIWSHWNNQKPKPDIVYFLPFPLAVTEEALKASKI